MHRRTRSQNSVLLELIPESAVEDPSLAKLSVRYSLSDVRPFGGKILYEYGWMFIRIARASANGNLRGRLYGKVHDKRLEGNANDGFFHTTSVITAFCGNIVRTEDGMVYSIDGISPNHTVQPQFDLEHLRNTLNLPAFGR